MSQKQRRTSIKENCPEEQRAKLADLFKRSIYPYEAEDMAFCIGLAEKHRCDYPVFNEEDFSPIEDVAKRLGVSLDDT